MEKIILLKLQQLDLMAATKSNKCQLLNPKISVFNTGFTLIELVAVTMMIGILAAIAAPSWITFTNQRRVNAANDTVLSALQSAQQEAKRQKLSYSVSFKTNNQVPQIAIHPNSVAASKLSNDTWKPLGADLAVKPGQFSLGTNLVAVNTADYALIYGSSTPQTITFNYMGNLPLPPYTNLGSYNQGLIVTVAVPKSSDSIEVLEATSRCVKVKTLLGAMQTGKQDECNAN